MIKNYRYNVKYRDGLGAYGIVRAKNEAEAEEYIASGVGENWANLHLREMTTREIVNEGLDDLRGDEELGIYTCDGC